jgi:hypothetical protein
MYYTKGDVKQKAKIGVAIIGVGAVIGVIYRNYTLDIKGIKREIIAENEPKVNFEGNKKPVKPNQYRGVFRRGNTIKFVA